MILRGVMAYATFSALWILLSDYVVTWLFSDPGQIRLVATLKGWGFVAVTSVLLFGWAKRLLGRPDPMVDAGTIQAESLRWRGLVYLFAVTGSVVTLVVRVAIAVSFENRPLLILFMFPILLSAFLGGLGPGLVATIVSAAGVAYWAIPPIHSFFIAGPEDFLQWGFLVTNGVLVSVLSERMHRSRKRAEATRELQAVTLESIGDAVITTDTAGRVTFLNPVAERLTGWACREAIGLPLQDVFHIIQEASRQPAEDPAKKALATGGISELSSQTLLIRKDGAEVPVLDSASPIRLKTGTVIGVVLVFRDDSERRALIQAQGEQLRALQLLDAIASTSSDAIFVKDLEGRYLLFNQESCRITGKSVEEAIGRDDRAVFPMAQAQRLMESDRQVIELGRPVIEEDVMPTSEGPRILLATKQPLRDAEGRIVGVFGIAKDVTEQRRADLALRESRASLEQAQAIAHVGSWRVDLVANTLTWSSETYRIHGIPSGTLVTFDRFITLIHPEDREQFLANWEKQMAGDLADLEFRILVGEGVKWVQTQAEVCRDESGKPILIFGTVQDITDRRVAELEKARMQAEFLQAQKLESIGRLAGGVAHDFNNMLQVITGNAEMALHRLSPGNPLYDEVQLIKGAADRSADLTRQLLAFARRQKISPKVLDLNDVIAHMLKMLGRLVGEDIKVIWTPKPGLWKTRIDPAQVDQILANLAVNARDAIEGVGMIELWTDHATFAEADCAGLIGARPGAYVTLAISDTGCGMDREILDHIFEPFFTTKGTDKGTGLGLATVFGIAQQNGGFIQVSSESGVGTTFRIHFPRFAEEASPADPAEASSLDRGSGQTVLLVEDDKALLAVGEAMLQDLGYAVLPVGSPGLALKMVQEFREPIHLFLVDVVMPGMNGRELAQRLSALRPGVPVLFMSGYTADVLEDRGNLGEGWRLLPKPFSLHELAAKVRETLESVR
jgi:two-component system, cell cycle sensor histidine kinase and response regulator CckA